MDQVDASIQRYLGMLDTADRQEGEAATLRTTRLTEWLSELRRQMRELGAVRKSVGRDPSVRYTAQKALLRKFFEHN